MPTEFSSRGFCSRRQTSEVETQSETAHPPHARQHTDMSFAELYEMYHPAILTYIRAIVDQRELAEDLCQETFVKVLRHWEQRDQSQPPGPWIYRIARNTAYDEFRLAYRRNVPFFNTNNVSSSERLADQVELRTTVRATLAQLPTHERVPLLMQVVGGCNLREIARVVGCSENGVKSRLFRSRARFQRLYSAANG